MAKKTLIPLLGMHRSGTSLAAHAFAQAGFPLGDQVMTNPQPDNIDGYWEDKHITNAHEQFLYRRFGNLAHVWGIPSLGDANLSDNTDSGDVDEMCYRLNERLGAIISERLATRSVFAFKDPRTARLLPIWIDLARKYNVQFVPVFLLRHPAAVAASLEKRNGIVPIIGELMWLRTVSDILRYVGDTLAGTIVYEYWFDQPKLNQRVIESVAAHVGLSPLSAWNGFKLDYRHEFSERCALPLCEEVYKALIATDGRKPDESSRRNLLSRIDGLVSSFGGWIKLAGALTMGQR